jgi:hypothetical protein
MSATPGDAYDYGYLQADLSKMLLRELWHESARRRFLAEFVRAPFSIDPAIPPIVGVGLSEPEDQQGPKLEFLSTIDGQYIEIKRLLESKNWQGARFGVTKTGRIVGCSRELQGGDRIARKKGSTGTFGCLVQDKEEAGLAFILSCNHVLASLDKGERMKDEIWGSTIPARRIGVLKDFKRLVLGPAGTNDVDAALCKPDDPTMIRPGLRQLGPVSGYVAKPRLNLPVRKEGAETGVTRGVLRMSRLSVLNKYETGEEAVFDGQLGIVGTTSGSFAANGDSGAIIIDENASAVGLLFARSEGVDIAYANPIELVFDALRVRLP